MKYVIRLPETYTLVIGALNDNFDSIEYQFEEVLTTVDRQALVNTVMEFIINGDDYLELLNTVRDRLGESVTRSFVNTLILEVPTSRVYSTFLREVKLSDLDTSGDGAFITVAKFGPNYSILVQ